MGRTSRWDRPPAPRDVRWFVRLVGKTLIVLGLLMFGFVAYQLWGTGIQTARAQRRLDSELSQMMVTTVVAPPSSHAATSAATVPSSARRRRGRPPRHRSPPRPRNGDHVEHHLDQHHDVHYRGPDDATIPTLDSAAFDVRHGDVLGTMSIPAIGIGDLKFVAGVDLDDLALGPGAYPESRHCPGCTATPRSPGTGPPTVSRSSTFDELEGR